MFMYIFSLFGMELFGKRAHKDIDGLIIPQDELVEIYHRGEVVNPIRLSFDNIYLSMNTIFVICMADGWNWVMYENVLPFGEKWWIYSIFFCLLFILGNKIQLSLFTAILLQNFEEEEEEEEKEEEEEGKNSD